jgi:hypothetical protein
MTIDTLEYVKKLEAAGMERRQAEAHAEALRGVVVPELATRQDLKDLATELRTEMGQLRSDLGAEIGQVRGEMGQMRSDLRTEIGQLRADMWKIALAVVLATASLTTFLQRLL